MISGCTSGTVAVDMLEPSHHERTLGTSSLYPRRTRTRVVLGPAALRLRTKQSIELNGKLDLYRCDGDVARLLGTAQIFCMASQLLKAVRDGRKTTRIVTTCRARP